MSRRAHFALESLHDRDTLSAAHPQLHLRLTDLFAQWSWENGSRQVTLVEALVISASWRWSSESYARGRQVMPLFVVRFRLTRRYYQCHASTRT